MCLYTVSLSMIVALMQFDFHFKAKNEKKVINWAGRLGPLGFYVAEPGLTFLGSTIESVNRSHFSFYFSSESSTFIKYKRRLHR
jgi:hypothetical protein